MLRCTAKVDNFKQCEDGVNGRQDICGGEEVHLRLIYAKEVDWFCSTGARNIHMTGQLFQANITELSDEKGYDGFTASNGWLQRFQSRHNIKCSVLSGESADVK